jgi:hypothetical protein
MRTAHAPDHRTDAPPAPAYEPAQPYQPAHRREPTGYALDAWNGVLRVVAVVAACVPLVAGLVGVARVDWSFDGFGSAPVLVDRMVMSPWIAVITSAIGLVGVLVAASVYRQPKLVWGALMACAGLVVLIAEPTVDHVVLNHRYGLLLFVPGLVLAAAALLMRRRAVAVAAPTAPAAY